MSSLAALVLVPRPRLVEELRECQPTALDCEPAAHLDESLPAQGFRLRIADQEISLGYRDSAGLRYGRALLSQLVSQVDVLPPVLIQDWPDFAVRGFMLDISRDRVPTMETLDRLVGVLALLRINHVQLYTEHTFAYSGHEAVWSDASPMTPHEVRVLDRRCAAVGIELVANQNTFGHMGRWLSLAEYKHRAEAPDGFGSGSGTTSPPATLEPTQDNADFVVGLCSELLSHHERRLMNIGCDEPHELGAGRSKDRCAAEGTQVVYLEHLNRIVSGIRDLGCDVLVWGDVLREHPEVAAKLPSAGVTVLVWHYEPPTETGTGGIGPHLASFDEAGIPYWVCPGTSTWNSLVGRVDVARANLLDAARCGLEQSASGYLITDWGDNGHSQPLSATWHPLVYGAAVSWCESSNADLHVAGIIDRYVVMDQRGQFGSLLERAGKLHGGLGFSCSNASPIFVALLDADVADAAELALSGTGDPEGLLAALGGVSAELLLVEQLDLGCPDALATRLELMAALRLVRHGLWRLADRAGTLVTSPAEMFADFEECIGLQRASWLARSRPGGLEDSLARLGEPAG